ncbi:Putative chloroperoxidase [Septoria linicola]|uniref:Chloroperoxidase n=1 Tax=Septoria linicola TaxID=215465 RepID=A0A9Q9EFQ6_9PEZI|nr:putative chloroperoxidase [Septoria linicola]USW47927.1 Putative chloroperoxidase [Septoria linicola]
MAPLASTIALLLPVVYAFPGGVHPAEERALYRPYKAPTGADSRGPCPMLNTLANHGYINHNGRNIEKQDLLNALLLNVGIQESCVETAMTNAFILCAFTTGADCGTTLHNLTLLGLPHAFEHDHSFSRQDYKMNYQSSPSENSDNLNFNSTIFQESLDVLGGSSHMNFQQMQQVRLQRESLSEQQAYPGWFTESIPIQEFEAGFIFGVMGDFNLPNYIKNPQVRVAWWKYWFSNEALPYELGWHPPFPPKDVNFLLSASSRILAATVTSTPSPLPSGALAGAPAPEALPTKVDTTTYHLATQAPYVGTIAHKGGIHLREAAAATATPAPVSTFTFKNPYVQTLAMEDIVLQQEFAKKRMAAQQ